MALDSMAMMSLPFLSFYIACFVPADWEAGYVPVV